MTILCSDKTGTLTKNKLSLNEPILFVDMTAEELVFYAALSSKRGGGQDAMDLCMTQGLSPMYRYLVTLKIIACDAWRACCLRAV